MANLYWELGVVSTQDSSGEKNWTWTRMDKWLEENPARPAK